MCFGIEIGFVIITFTFCRNVMYLKMADFKLRFEGDNWVTRSQFMLGEMRFH